MYCISICSIYAAEPYTTYSAPISLSIKTAQKPFVIGSLGPEALKYESFEGKGIPLVVEQAQKDLNLALDGLAEAKKGLGFRVWGS